MSEWVEYIPNIPENGQVVFILTDKKAIFIAQAIYGGKDFLGNETVMFYIYQANTYISDKHITHYLPVILPQPPGSSNDNNNKVSVQITKNEIQSLLVAIKYLEDSGDFHLMPEYADDLSEVADRLQETLG